MEGAASGQEERREQKLGDGDQLSAGLGRLLLRWTAASQGVIGAEEGL